jgi:hypothetical protein
MRGRVDRGFHGRLGRESHVAWEEFATENQRYSVDEFREQLRRFESELGAAGLKESSVTTYVDRTGRFLKWHEGGYQPRAPN